MEEYLKTILFLIFNLSYTKLTFKSTYSLSMNVYLKYLKRKYPFDVLNWKIILVIGGLIALMIYFFTPFGFGTYQGNQFIAAVGFGLVTCLCLLISNMVIKRRLLSSNNNRWTILGEIGYTVLVLLIISVSNLSYFIILFDEGAYFASNNIGALAKALIGIILYTLAIGIIPITGVILYRYNKMLKNSLSDIIRGEQKKKDIELKKKLTFPSQNIRDKELSIFLDEILFMEATRNHVHIYFMENENVVTKSIRNTLTNIIENLSEESLFRCHRSFLINLNRVKNAKGNSNGYKVTLHGYDPEIPVSRNFAAEFQKLIY